MKKNYFILSFVLLITTLGAQAQVVNGNFEVVKPNFLPSNWGMNFLQAVVIDPVTGETLSDNIQYTWCVPSMVYATTDARSGEYAMEISNAFNQTQNIVIPGSAMIFSDATQDIPGWNPGIPIEPGTNVQTLGFYYKFLPLGNDVAEGRINVFDETGNEIGSTIIQLSGTNNQFNYIYSYINYTSNATPAFMYISFAMANETSTPTFGSRLIIDDVVVNFQSLSIDQSPLSTAFNVYPTLVDGEINIVPSSEMMGSVTYKIINTQGRVVRENTVTNESSYIYTMNVSELSSGMYFLEVASNSEKMIRKFIKK